MPPKAAHSCYDECGDDEEEDDHNDDELNSCSSSRLSLPVGHGERDVPQSVWGAWRCSICTFDNPEELQACDVCGVTRKGGLLIIDDCHSSIDPPARRMSRISGASILAKSLFAPLPEGKIKRCKYFQHDTGKMHANVREFQRVILSSSHSTSPSLVSVASSVAVLTSTSDTLLQGSNADLVQIHGTVSAVPTLNTLPVKKDTRRMLGGKQKLEEINSSLSSLSLNEKPILDGLGNEKISSKKLGNDEYQMGSMLPLDLYKPESWMINDVRKESKQALNISIVGHVDAGKSTLLGKLLYHFGQISQKDMQKYERDARKKGKGSFAYAWVLDESPEERARGVTMTVAVAHFKTSNLCVFVLDSPGHKDFVPSMISGASQADAVLLIVDASFGAFEAGMNGEGTGGGQTKEHTQLARSLGVEQIVVVVNKMDAVNYSQKRFDEIKDSLRPFLRQCGFNNSGTKWVPTSAIESQNLMGSPAEDLFKSWYSGPSLIEVIDKLQPPSRAIFKPLRIPVVEAMRAHSLGQAAISGKLESGAVKVGSKVLVMPVREVATVRGIEQAGQSLPSAWAGESVDIGLQGVEPFKLVPGGVLCHPDYPVPVASCLEARVLVLKITVPLLCGSQLILYCHQAKEPARITKLISVLDPKTGAVIHKKPRCLVSYQSALIELVPERPVCAEEYYIYRALGRISLRDAGKTLAVGIIVHITKQG